MKLNLGCGSVIRPKAEGWLNHDICLHDGVDRAFDLTQFPWPTGDWQGKVEELELTDVFEHIPAHLSIPFMNECWDLLIPGGIVRIQVPVFGTHCHLGDLTHCRGFSVETFDILDPDTAVGRRNPWYTSKRWRILERRQDTPPPKGGYNLHFVLAKRIPDVA